MTRFVQMCAGDFSYFTLMAPCIKSVSDYCSRHGYDHTVYNVRVTDRPPGWDRVPILLAEMEAHPDEFLVWVDADAMVTNPACLLEDVFALMRDTDKHVAYTLDSSCNLNDGVAIYRNTERTKDYLQWLWQQDRFRDHPWWVCAAAVAAQADRHDFFERHVLRITNTHVMNAYVRGRDPWQLGDFIVHFAGLSTEDRLLLIHAFSRFVASASKEIEALTPNLTRYWLGVQP